MGLLQKADRITEKSSQKSTKRYGLLHKTLDILYQSDRETQKTRLLTQEEVDHALAKSIKNHQVPRTLNIERKTVAKKPSVPLTWNEIGKEAPEYRPPQIENEDINRALAANKEASEGRETTHPEEPFDSGKIESLISEIERIPEGLETPVLLFSKIRDFIGIRKGAILLYDPLHMVFAPWSSIGYDETTLHRLRIPLGANDSFNSLADGNIQLIEADTRNEYKNYFSNREFSLIEKIILVPMIHKNKLNAVFLITQLDNEEQLTIQHMSHFFKTLDKTVSKKIYDAREEKLQLLKELKPEDLQSLKSLVKKDILYAKSINAGLHLFTMHFKTLTERDYWEKETTIDRFRIDEDIARILRSLFSGIGRVIRIKTGTYLVSVYKARNYNFTLIRDQLKYNLDFFFRDLEITKTLIEGIDYREKNYPQNGQNEEEILAGLL